MRHLFFSSVIVAAVVSLSPLASFSQTRQIGGVGLTVFAETNFRGRAATLRDDTPDFRTIGMNNMVSSLQVGPNEQWEVCERANYQGRCIVVSGSESDLRRSGFTNLISSARRVRGGGRGRGGSSSGGLELFSRIGFGGDSRAFTGPESDLRRVRFNNTAQSLRVSRGQQWEVCRDTNFRNCQVVNSDLSDLRGLGMSGRVSSVRPSQQGGRGIAVPRSYLMLFDDRAYRGQSFRIDSDLPVMREFANRARSVQVFGDGSWQLCDRANFGGKCVAVSRHISDLSTMGISRRVASVRRTPSRR
ncbi:MAG TPA: beta/gamma crystallin-related protein [Vicinamibacterales bacterium]